jgi:hypothetical protein
MGKAAMQYNWKFIADRTETWRENTGLGDSLFEYLQINTPSTDNCDHLLAFFKAVARPMPIVPPAIRTTHSVLSPELCAFSSLIAVLHRFLHLKQLANNAVCVSDIHGSVDLASPAVSLAICL